MVVWDRPQEKPSEGRLPDWFQEGINQIIGFGENSERTKKALHEITKELLDSECAKTASIIQAEATKYYSEKLSEAIERLRVKKDAEHQQKIAEIFEEIENTGIIRGRRYIV